MDEATTAPEFLPPYMAFQTFWSFIGSLGAHPLPPKIDRSMMGSKSGTDQASLMGALRGFGLVGEGHEVQPALRELAEADEERRSELLAELIRRFYPAQVAVSESNGTKQQLDDSFRSSFDLSAAETRRKATTFFLHAARVAQLPLSPHFPPTRTGSGGPGTPRAKRPTAKRKPPATAPPTDGTAQAAASDARTVDDLRRQYFDLLVTKAAASDAPDDLFNRIELVVGLRPGTDTPAGPSATSGPTSTPSHPGEREEDDPPEGGAS
ncbi:MULTISPECIES: hypothetical protein [unclassified Frankia]|uniref:hypothetical protein n=1 Tax=unclassified Frankia TaxID=2632575 RepID=UPI001932CD40|nr:MULTISPECIES: hypothetical protein [unclassified Frankia]MBL7619875.1 hypothetical protein [Frankia sp. AgB1.8]